MRRPGARVGTVMPGPKYTWKVWPATAAELTAKLQAYQDDGWEIVSVCNSYLSNGYLIVCRK